MTVPSRRLRMPASDTPAASAPLVPLPGAAGR
jgi:hypothetical protein